MGGITDCLFSKKPRPKADDIETLQGSAMGLREYMQARHIPWDLVEEARDHESGMYDVTSLVMAGTLAPRAKCLKLIAAARAECDDLRAGVTKCSIRSKSTGALRRRAKWAHAPEVWGADQVALQRLIAVVGRRGTWELAFHVWGKGPANFERAHMDAPAGATTFPCFIKKCRHTFSNDEGGKRAHRKHMYNKHRFFAAGAEPHPAWPQCESCKQVFSKAQAAEEHGLVCPKVHNGPRVCNDAAMYVARLDDDGTCCGVEEVFRPCNKTFTNAKAYLAHRAAVHEPSAWKIINERHCGKKLLMCKNHADRSRPQCTKVFSTPATLNKHRMWCSQANRVLCFHCGLDSKNMGAFRKHRQRCGKPKKGQQSTREQACSF